MLTRILTAAPIYTKEIAVPGLGSKQPIPVGRMVRIFHLGLLWPISRACFGGTGHVFAFVSSPLYIEHCGLSFPQ